MRILLGLIVGVGMVWGQISSGVPQSGHCAGTGMGTLSNHEVPIIVEDGSIRIVAYRSHFDRNLLSKVLEQRPGAPTAKKKRTGTVEEDVISKWHTHDGDHMLQIAVAVPSSDGKSFRTQVHQFTLFATDKVELELQRGRVVAESVWLSKEVDDSLSSICHPTPTTQAEKLGWVLHGPGNITKKNVTLSDTPDFVNLEYVPDSGDQGPLRLRGVRVWSKKPGNSKRLTPKATFELGTGCASVQICPNDKDGKPACLAIDPPCTLERYTGRAGEKNEVLQK